MAKHDLQVLYEKGVLKDKGFPEIDEAIAAVMDVISPRDDDAHFTYKDFLAAWENLLHLLLCNFPDVSAYNLVWLDHGLEADRRHLEVLMVRRYIAELLPDTCEAQCFLGHAYHNVGDLEAAAAYYQRAYDLAMRWVEENDPDDPSCPTRLDACDYLCHLAEAESGLRCFADAFAHMVQAFNIMITGGAAFKQKRVYGILHRICLGMEWTGLAEHYRLLSVTGSETEPEADTEEVETESEEDTEE